MVADGQAVIDSKTAHRYPVVDGVLTVPEGVVGIVGAYRGDQRLKKVILPEGLRFLGDSAFNYCEHLESAELPSTLEEIGEYAFASCSRLREVVLPNGLRRLGPCAFAHCSGLERIEIPPSVEEFGDRVFEGCDPDLVFVVQHGSPICEFLKSMAPVRLEMKIWAE